MAGQQELESRNFPDWSESSLGQSLITMERTALQTCLPSLKGSTAIQVGCNAGTPLLESCNFPHRFILADHAGLARPVEEGGFQYLESPHGNLPLASESVDLCLLPHVLEFSPTPHDLLREVERVLVSGGHAVILGFNPYSVWGIRSLFTKDTGPAPWNGHYLSVRRLRDWLRLLDFDINAGMMLYYRPPSRSVVLRNRLAFLEKAGNRWWPMLSAVYMLTAQKNVAGMTIIEMKQRFRKVPYLNVVEPVAKTRGHCG